MRFYNTHGASAPILSEGESSTDFAFQFVNSIAIAAGGMSLAWGVSENGMPVYFRIALILFGVAFAGKSVLDLTLEYLPKSGVKPIAQVKEAEPPSLRNSRREMLLLLDRAIEVSGDTSDVVPSDDKLGAGWSSNNRGRVLALFPQDTFMVVTRGKARGTIVKRGNLGTLREAVIQKQITPVMNTHAL